MVSYLKQCYNPVQGGFGGAPRGSGPGQGLDFSGDFVYAVNCNGPGGLHVGDAVFTSDTETDGVEVVAEGMVDWGEEGHPPTFHGTPDDTALGAIIATCRWSMNPVTATLHDLDPHAEYRLQLLFYATDYAHGFDVLIDGVLLADDFSVQALRGGWDASNPQGNIGAFFRFDFTGRTAITISLDCSDLAVEADVAKCPAVLSGFTLERTSAVVRSDIGRSKAALKLVDDAYVKLPPMVLGESVSVTAWLQVGTLWDGAQGMTLFNSFQGTDCGDSDACRNAVGGTLERHPKGAWPPARFPEPHGPADADAERDPVLARLDNAALARDERLRSGAPCRRVTICPEHQHVAPREAVREPSLTRLAHPHNLVAEEADGARADEGVSRLIRRSELVPGLNEGHSLSLWSRRCSKDG